jgi:hypothetical protein
VRATAINDDERGANLFRFFCRHLVALGASYWLGPHPAGERPKFTAYSGTLISVRNVVYYLTAGHALRDLRDAMQSPLFKRDSICLIDSFGPNPVDNHPIPLALKPEEIFFIDDHELGLDFGLIPLRPFYVNLLRKNGIIALGEEQWMHQHRIRFDGYMMLGLPAEFTAKTLTNTGDALVKPTMIGVQPLPPESVPPQNSVYERFCGQISNDIQSAVGMSGGPILGFNFDGPVRYWVVAIQSAWQPSSRTVFGCPLPTLASLITEWTDGGVASDARTPEPGT